MRRVLLAVEDYNELVFLEAVFRKVGLDVESMQNDVAVPERILGFSPEMIVLSSYGNRVNPTKLLPRIRRKDGYPRVVLLYRKGSQPTSKDIKTFMVDAMLESPVHPRKLLEAVEQLFGLDEEVLLKKMERTDTANRDENSIQHVKGGAASARFPVRGGAPDKEDPRFQSDEAPVLETLSDFKEKYKPSEESMNRKSAQYKIWAESEFLPPFKPIGRERVSQIENEWRETEDDPEIKSIDEERKAFVRELFKKK